MPIDLLADESPIDLLADEPTNNAAPEKGFLGNYLDYAKGVGLGGAQGFGDALASIGNFPSSLYEHFTGKQPYHIPHPSLQKYYPESAWGSFGSTLGNIEGQMLAPGGITFKALKAFNNPLAKALAGSVAGGLSGAASDEGHRLTSGAIGAGLGAGIPLSKGLMEALGNVAPITKSIAYSPYIKKTQYMKEHGLGSNLFVHPERLNEAERLMKSMNVPQEAIEEVLPRARQGEHDAIHAVQSTLKSVGRDLSRKGGVEGRLGEKFHGLAEKIMKDVNDQMKIMGHKKAVDLELQGKKRTAKYYKMKPYVKTGAKIGLGAAGAGGLYDFLKHNL